MLLTVATLVSLDLYVTLLSSALAGATETFSLALPLAFLMFITLLLTTLLLALIVILVTGCLTVTVKVDLVTSLLPLSYRVAVIVAVPLVRGTTVKVLSLFRFRFTWAIVLSLLTNLT